MKIQNKLIFFIFLLGILLPASFAFAQDTTSSSLKIKIEGVNKEIEENIRANLSILYEEEESDSARLSQLEERAKHEIDLAVQPFGYYHATIESQLRLSPTPLATFTILLGPPTRVQSIQINLQGEGQSDPTLSGITSLFTLKIGDILVHDTYDIGKKALLAKAIQNGYLNAFFSEHVVEVDPETNLCKIFLTLETGSKHYFGEITFSPSTLSENLRRRYLPFRPGDPYAPEKISLLQGYLTDSDYFSTINVKSFPEDNSTNVPIMVETEDAKPNKYILGAGYGTDTGLRAKLGWTRRMLNPSGHRFMAEAQISEVYEKLQVEYTIPGKKPYSDQVKLKAGFFEDQYSQQTSDIFEGGVTFEHAFYDWKNLVSLLYHQEEFNAYITNDKVQSRLILPSITFIQTRKEEGQYSPKGRRIEISFKGSVDALFSDTSFFQAYSQFKWLHPIHEGLKALFRVELGIIFPDDIQNLALSQRFYAGGDLSLRGYGYRTLPNEIDKNGNRHPPGGAYLGIGSLEIVKTIRKPFGIFTFVDAGNAFRKDDNEIAIGTGVGIEWQTRLGPIKFAVAKPLTKPSDSWRIHASFGPEI